MPIVAAAPSENAVLSTASSGVLNGLAPGRCNVAVMYSLWCRIRPSRASARAFSRVSAMCQLSSTRQFLRSTILPCLAAAASAKPHCVGRALRPSSDSEPIEMMPMPCLPAERHAGRADLRRDRERHLLLQRQQLQCRVVQREPVAFGGDPLAAEQAADDADRLVLPVAQEHRIDAERVRVGGQRARPGAEDRPAAGHVVELHHALRDVERMMIGQRDDAGGELDALRPLARGGEEHLRRGDHFPAAGMMFAAPEFVVAELVEMLDEVEIAAELQHRVFADRMMRREEGAEIQAGHA